MYSKNINKIIIVFIILLFSCNTVLGATSWTSETFGGSVTVDELSSTWHVLSFGGSVTVDGASSGNVTWYTKSMGGGVRVYGETLGNWSDWWVMTYSVYAPPQDFDAVAINDTLVNVSFTKNPEATHTHVRRKIGSYPNDRTDGVLAFNKTGDKFDDSGLNVGTNYFYRAWSYNSTSNQWAAGYSNDSCWTLPGNTSSFAISSNSTTSITLSWTKGLNASTSLIRYSDTSFPTTTTSGSFGYNGSSNTREISGLQPSTQYYFSIWSHVNPFSQGYQTVTGNTTAVGNLTIYVFKETEPWIPIKNYSVFIKNQDGSQTYHNDSVNNPHTIYLASGDLPIGNDILIQISREGYYPRMIYTDLDSNFSYNLTFYLAPDIEGGGDPTDPDYVPPDDSDNESYASHYIVIVKDEQSNPLKDVKVDIERYINETESYESVYVLYTDGNGEIGVDLIPNAVYQVTLSKTGYITEVENWAPPIIVYSNDVYKEFILTVEPFDPHDPDILPEEITFTARRTNTTIWLNYTDNMQQTSNLSVYLYEMYLDGTITLIYNNSLINSSAFNLNVIGVNTTSEYKAVLYINHSFYGNQHFTRIIRIQPVRDISVRSFGSFLALLVGYNPFGWGNFLLFLFLVVGLYYADQKDAGLVMILVGGIFLFLNIVLGYSSTLFTIAGGVLPSIFFVAGIVTIWKQRRDNN